MPRRYAVEECWEFDIQEFLLQCASKRGGPPDGYLFSIYCPRREWSLSFDVIPKSWVPDVCTIALRRKDNGDRHYLIAKKIERGCTKRWLFVCPVTQELVQKLYLTPANDGIANRTAHNLAYWAQRYSGRTLLGYRISKLRLALGWSPDPFDKYGNQPPHMRWKAFERKLGKLFALEDLFFGPQPSRGRPRGLRSKGKIIRTSPLPLSPLERRVLAVASYWSAVHQGQLRAPRWVSEEDRKFAEKYGRLPAKNDNSRAKTTTFSMTCRYLGRKDTSTQPRLTKSTASIARKRG